MARYRNSQLRTRRACRYAAWRTYQVGDPGLPSEALEAGRRIHAAVNEAVRRIVEGANTLDIHDIAHRVVRGGGAEYADALRVLTRFQEALGLEFQIDPKTVFLTEEQLEMPVTLPDGSEHVFFGTPDMAERVKPRRVRITDWKTHWSPMSTEEFHVDPQLPRYFLLVRHHYPAFEEAELVMRFVRWQDCHHRRVMTADELDAVRRELVSEISEAEATRIGPDGRPPRATGGAWCALCPHHHTCPLIARILEDGAPDLVTIGDDERARELAGDLMAIEGARQRIQTQLKRYLGAGHPRGAVPVAGGEYGYGPRTHRDLEVDALRRVLREQKLEWTEALQDEVLRVDVKALDRLAGRLPEGVVRAIERATRHHQTSQCRFRRSHPTNETPGAAAAVQEEALL